MTVNDEEIDDLPDNEDEVPDDESGFALRDYRPGDAAALATVFRDAVCITGAAAYNEPQVKAWAALADNLDAFTSSLDTGWVRVALDEHGCVGFGQINMPGHLAMLYTAPRAARKGVASAILDDLAMLGEAMGARSLTADASHLARPLLLKRGFGEVAREEVERDGVVFERFRMEAKLGR
jgi:putative acetyltransferase